MRRSIWEGSWGKTNPGSSSWPHIPEALLSEEDYKIFIGPCYELWAAPTGLSLGSAVPTTALQYQTGANGASEILRAAMTQASSTTSTQTAWTLARFGATPS